MRGWVSDVANYSEPMPLGAVVRAFAVGRVEASRHSDFKLGEFVTGMFGWQDYAAVEVQVIRLGDVAFATNRFELYLDYGMRI